jgi:hypothetical protein
MNELRLSFSSKDLGSIVINIGICYNTCMPTISTLLDIPKAWESVSPLRNLLFKPVQLGVKWSQYFNCSLPARVAHIFQDMKTGDKLLGAIAFAPAMKGVYEGPKEKEAFLQGDRQTKEVQYTPLLSKGALYMGFASKLLKSAVYLNGDQKHPLLSDLNLLVEAISELLNICLKIDLSKKLIKGNFDTSEVNVAICQGSINFMKLSLVISQYINGKGKKSQLFNLTLSTALTAASYFSYYYNQWYVAPRKPNR